MIVFLVARDHAGAVAEAARRGWAAVAYGRWAGAGRDDVRMALRLSEMPAIPGARLARAEGFEGHPEGALFEAEAARRGGWLECPR